MKIGMSGIPLAATASLSCFLLLAISNNVADARNNVTAVITTDVCAPESKVVLNLGRLHLV
jgi:hypothetical protein